MSRRTSASDLPPRRTLVDLGLAAYFVVLFTAPFAVTPAVSEGTSLSYDVALRNVVGVIAVGYFLGLAVLLRLQ